VFIGDVTETYVTEAFEVEQIMQIGNDNRSIGVTDMNKQSSRSHSCFIMTITQNNSVTFTCKTGKLYLVDLAGSEKISKTGASGQTLDEAKKINKSLSTLGLVINNLTDGKSKHIPYRDSKLTRILQESLGGNSKTCLIITCSPSIYNEAETVSTLRFGQRAKRIQNKPKINKELSVAELKHLLEEAERTIEKKDKRIRNLEKIIKAMGGTVPEEKDDFIQRSSGRDDKLSSPKRTREEIDEMEANAKLDALDDGSSDGDYSDVEVKNDENEEQDDAAMNIETDNSDKPSNISPEDDEQKTGIEALSETIALLEKSTLECKDAETMTESVTMVSVKTNTNIARMINAGTSIHYEYSTTETMTEEDKQPTEEVEIQVSFPKSDASIVTEPITISEEESQEPSDAVDTLVQPKDDLVERIEELKKEYLDSEVQSSEPFIDQDEFNRVISNHEAQIKAKKEQLNQEKEKLTEALKSLEEQRRMVSQKSLIISEQQEEIDRLSAKIQDCEIFMSDDRNVIESQTEIIAMQETKMNEQKQLVEEQTAQLSHSADRIDSLETDLKQKEESFQARLKELQALLDEDKELKGKYDKLKSAFKLKESENNTILEKIAESHIKLEELEIKNKKYKKQLFYMQEEQQKKIDLLREQRANDEKEIEKFKAQIREKEEMFNKLLEKSAVNSADIKSIVEESYKKMGDIEKSKIFEENQNKIRKQKEDLEKELETKKSIIRSLEEKYEHAKEKLSIMKGDLIDLQKKKMQSDNKKINDKKMILKVLNDKTKKIETLEKEIESWKIKHSELQSFMGEDQKQSYHKIQTLTKNMNQLNQMFKQIVNSESIKQEKHILESKLERRNKKIKSLEEELSVTRDQVAKLKSSYNRA